MQKLKGTLLGALICLITGALLSLTGCVSNNSATYGIPPNIWNKMSFEQRQQIVVTHQKAYHPSSSGYGSDGFVVEHDTN